MAKITKTPTSAGAKGGKQTSITSFFTRTPKADSAVKSGLKPDTDSITPQKRKDDLENEPQNTHQSALTNSSAKETADMEMLESDDKEIIIPSATKKRIKFDSGCTILFIYRR